MFISRAFHGLLRFLHFFGKQNECRANKLAPQLRGMLRCSPSADVGHTNSGHNYTPCLAHRRRHSHVFHAYLCFGSIIGSPQRPVSKRMLPRPRRGYPCLSRRCDDVMRCSGFAATDRTPNERNASEAQRGRHLYLEENHMAGNKARTVRAVLNRGHHADAQLVVESMGRHTTYVVQLNWTEYWVRNR